MESHEALANPQHAKNSPSIENKIIIKDQIEQSGISNPNILQQQTA